MKPFRLLLAAHHSCSTSRLAVEMCAEMKQAWRRRFFSSLPLVSLKKGKEKLVSYGNP
jgi:hypothetical protein